MEKSCSSHSFLERLWYFSWMENRKINLLNVSVVIGIISVIYLFYVAATPTWVVSGEQRLNSESMKQWLQDMDAASDGDLAADRLQEYCSADSAIERGFCTGYLLGFIEGYEVSPAFDICSGDGLQSADQIEKAYQNYMDAHPEHWKKPRAPILGAAIQQSFPCSSQY